MIKWIVLLATLSLAVAGCAVVPKSAPLPPTTALLVDATAVERLRLQDSPTPAAAPTVPSAPSVPAARPAIVVSPNSLYVCVVDVGGVRKQTAIEFAPEVGELCAKHPERSPCQYERNACRRSGGRIYAASGMEITMATEADYDKKVLRVRFKGG